MDTEKVSEERYSYCGNPPLKLLRFMPNYEKLFHYARNLIVLILCNEGLPMSFFYDEGFQLMFWGFRFFHYEKNVSLETLLSFKDSYLIEGNIWECNKMKLVGTNKVRAKVLKEEEYNCLLLLPLYHKSFVAEIYRSW